MNLLSTKLRIKLRISGLLLVMACSITSPLAFAKGETDGEGVKVDKMSRLRNLVPADELEAAASQQYVSLRQQAQQKGVLAPSDHPQTVRLRKIAERLIPQGERWNPRAKQWQWEVSLIESKNINAFCMPGGKIAFFTGLINQLKLTDDETAIVMGHEMAHALREHSRERMAKAGITNLGSTVLGIGLSAIFGVDPNLTTAATGQGANLLIMKFSRDDETESDVVGLEIVARAGFDPRAGVALWEKMAAVSKNAPPQWFSTHPAGKNRIAEIRKHLPTVVPMYARAKGVAPRSLPPYQTNVKGIAPVS